MLENFDRINIIYREKDHSISNDSGMKKVTLSASQNRRSSVIPGTLFLIGTAKPGNSRRRMTVMKYDRQVKIKQMFIDRKQISCKELCEQFDISIETVRRDLAELEAEGVIRRLYGGAILSDNSEAPNPMKPWDTRIGLNNTEKVNIAKEILRYIEDGMTIALDSGTTMLEIARLLYLRKNLNIITNDIHAAQLLSLNTDHTIYLVGGSVKKDDMITVGFLTTEFMKNFSHIDLALVTADGFKDGIADFNVDMGSLKGIMIEKADKVYAALDHSKFSVPALYKVCGFTDLDLVVTGEKAPAEVIEQLREAGVEVILVPCE